MSRPLPVRLSSVSALAVFFLLAVAARASTPLEPEWNGSSLSELVQHCRGPSRARLGKGSDLLFAEEPKVTVQQIRAEQGICAIGTNALPMLLEWLRADRIRDACAGFEALKDLAQPAVPQLISWAQADDGSLRDKAILALGKIGPGASAAGPLLLREVRNGNVSAVTAVGQIRLRSPEVVQALVGQLGSNKFDGKDCWFEMQVAIAIGNIGPAAASATKPLIEMLDKIEAVIQAGAGRFQLGLLAQRTIETLGKLGDDQALPTLNRMLVAKRNPGNLTNLALRRTLMQTVGSFGPAARDALPILLEISSSPHTESRDKALATEAIMRIKMQAL